jgi:hypothetical protein
MQMQMQMQMQIEQQHVTGIADLVPLPAPRGYTFIFIK